MLYGNEVDGRVLPEHDALNNNVANDFVEVIVGLDAQREAHQPVHSFLHHLDVDHLGILVHVRKDVVGVVLYQQDKQNSEHRVRDQEQLTRFQFYV